MIILAGEPCGENAKRAMELGCGCMIPCTPTKLPGPRHRKFQALALDNGAFSCYANGRLFDGDLFKRSVDRVNHHKLNLMFVVCPDKVAGGLDSLDFSEWWRPRVQYSRVALVVQDGIHGDDIEGIIDDYHYLFVGGSVEWKWLYAQYWVKWGHERGVAVHIGQCGQLGMMLAADRIGADSIDSTSWAQHDAWWIVRTYRENKQIELGLSEPPPLSPPKSERTPDLRWSSRKVTK